MVDISENILKKMLKIRLHNTKLRYYHLALFLKLDQCIVDMWLIHSMENAYSSPLDKMATVSQAKFVHFHELKILYFDSNFT